MYEQLSNPELHKLFDAELLKATDDTAQLIVVMDIAEWVVIAWSLQTLIRDGSFTPHDVELLKLAYERLEKELKDLPAIAEVLRRRYAALGTVRCFAGEGERT